MNQPGNPPRSQRPDALRPTQDLRGFRDALEPLRRRQQWRLESAERDLARALAAVAQARDARDQARDQYEREAGQAARSLQDRVDLAQWQRTLGYLARQQARHTGLAAELDRLQRELDDRRSAFAVAQQTLDGLDRQYEGALREFAADQARRAATQSDSDWLARRQWLARAAGVLPGDVS